ncbi:hypothetical protein QM797_02410 [Rhodococcus sp. IEGM 1381]|uniref:hypothetical protein n=1 Tax=Rhodococcus sp. IEGM 1381 TaxID=3047085 RepID=UPI0024B7C893|nr:hypothetical protein [Rhodococcus sp. IEGM 1381]MDI9893567.1 hypothetical protein [Rhodococcus sp. IEGM 1381]
MRKLFTLIGLSLGLVCSLGYLVWENRPRRVNYAFVVDDSAYTGILGLQNTTLLIIIGLPVLGALLGLAIAVSVDRIRRN